MVVGQGLWLAALGLTFGLGGAYALMRVMTSLLYGVAPSDPITYVDVGALLVGIAVIASYLPARRATRVDPMIALRVD